MSDPDMRVSETPPTPRQALRSNALGARHEPSGASPRVQAGATEFGPTGVN